MCQQSFVDLEASQPTRRHVDGAQSPWNMSLMASLFLLAIPYGAAKGSVGAMIAPIRTTRPEWGNVFLDAQVVFSLSYALFAFFFSRWIKNQPLHTATNLAGAIKAAGCCLCAAAVQYNQKWLIFVGWGIFAGIATALNYISASSNNLRWLTPHGRNGLGVAIFASSTFVAAAVFNKFWPDIFYLGAANLFLVLGGILFVPAVLASPLLRYPSKDYAEQVAEDKNKEVSKLAVNLEQNKCNNKVDPAAMHVESTSEREGTRASIASSALDQTADAIPMNLSTRFSYLESSPNLDGEQKDGNNDSDGQDSDPSLVCTLQFWITAVMMFVVQMIGGAIMNVTFELFTQIRGETDAQAGQSALIVLLVAGAGKVVGGVLADYMDMFTMMSVLLLIFSALALSVSYTYSSTSLFMWGIAVQIFCLSACTNISGPLGVHVFKKRFPEAWPKLVAFKTMGTMASVLLFSQLLACYRRAEGEGYPDALRIFSFIAGVLGVIVVIPIGYLRYKHGATTNTGLR